MPKIVDHPAQRRAISEAVCAVMATGGIEAVSVRNVAAAAGMSIGRLQHYVTSKDDMLLAAMEHVAALGQERVQADLAQLGADPKPEQVVRSVLGAMLPEDDRTRDLIRVGLAFETQAAVTPHLREHLRAGYEGLVTLLTDLIGAAAPTGSALSPEDEAIALLSLADGLSSHVLVGHVGVDHARRLLGRRITEVFRAQPAE